MLVPWPMKLIIDYVLKGKSLPENLAWLTVLPGTTSPLGLLGWLSASTVLLFLAQRLVVAVQGYVQTGVGARIIYRLGGDLFDHLQRLSLRVHAKQRAGDLVARVTRDSACGRDLIIGVLLPILTSLASLVAVFLVMYKLDPSLSVLALVAVVPLPIFMKLLTPEMTERSYEKAQLQGQFMSHIEQTLSALPVVQAFTRESHQDKMFRSLSTRILRANIRSLSSQLKFKVAVTGPTALGAATMMVLGGVHVLQGSLTVGSLLVFLAYLDSLYRPIATLANISGGLALTKASARRVLEILEANPDVQDAVGAKPLARETSAMSVRLEEITFGYEPGRPVLQKLSLEARPGEVVALVGATGAGKSTLVSLIARFFDPWQGRVTVNGIDVRDIQVSSLRAHVALVLQDPFLLPLTIAENIAYARPDASRDEIVQAAVAANADVFIRRLPDGYDTLIAERGASLSGGEKQLIAIARALLKNAPILILDEPTSALDAETEAMLLEALDRLMAGRTTFIIAHRLSTIRNADRIAVIEDGKVLEVGTHRELLATKNSYYRYHTLQNRTVEALRS